MISVVSFVIIYSIYLYVFFPLRTADERWESTVKWNNTIFSHRSRLQAWDESLYMYYTTHPAILRQIYDSYRTTIKLYFPPCPIYISLTNHQRTFHWCVNEATCHSHAIFFFFFSFSFIYIFSSRLSLTLLSFKASQLLHTIAHVSDNLMIADAEEILPLNWISLIIYPVIFMSHSYINEHVN